MRNFRVIFIVLFSIMLTSCDYLGIEVTTVKGEWKSQVYKNQYLILELLDNGISNVRYYNDNDSVYFMKSIGSWSLHNDTLNLYNQTIDGDGVRQYKIEQMSMNILTLRKLTNNSIWVMTRQYSTASSDYNSQFEEVFDLKKDFWWYVWRIFISIQVLIVFRIVYELLKHLFLWSKKWIRRVIKKK